MHFLFCLSVSFCLGILIASFINIPFLFLSTMILVALNFIFIKNKKSAYLLLVLFLFLGALNFSNYKRFPYNHLLNLNIKSQPVSIEGIVISDPRNGDKLTSFVYDARYLISDKSKIKISGKLLVHYFGDKDFIYGEKLVLEGNVSRVYNFGDFDYRKFLYRQNIYYIFNVSKDKKAEILKSKNSFIKSIFNLRKKLDFTIKTNISYPNNSILSAIILGKQENIPQDLRKVFVETGTAHILAISGLNIGIVLFIFLVVLKILRMKRKLRYFICAALLILYCILTGATPSVVRATIMGVVFLLGLILERELNIHNSLALSALIILGLNPAQVFDLGFELSFLSVLAIVFLYPKIINLFKHIKFSRPQFLIQGISVSLAAWLGILPLTIYNFRIISPVTILANLIIVPLSNLITATGFTFLIIGSIFPFLTSIFAKSCEFLTQMMIIITYWFSRWPFAYFRI